MYSVALKKVVEKMQLENCTPEIDISHILIKQPDVNRPALQLAGFFDLLKYFVMHQLLLFLILFFHLIVLTHVLVHHQQLCTALHLQ